MTITHFLAHIYHDRKSRNNLSHWTMYYHLQRPSFAQNLNIRSDINKVVIWWSSTLILPIQNQTDTDAACENIVAKLSAHLWKEKSNIK